MVSMEGPFPPYVGPNGQDIPIIGGPNKGSAQETEIYVLEGALSPRGIECERISWGTRNL